MTTSEATETGGAGFAKREASMNIDDIDNPPPKSPKASATKNSKNNNDDSTDINNVWDSAIVRKNSSLSDRLFKSSNERASNNGSTALKSSIRAAGKGVAIAGKGVAKPVVKTVQNVSKPRPTDHKVVGLKNVVMMNATTHSQGSWRANRREFLLEGKSTKNAPPGVISVEEKEAAARKGQLRNPILLFLLGNVAAFKVMFYYLISLETILTCCITAGLTVYWYNYAEEQERNGVSWNGGGLDFIVLAFAVTSPVSHIPPM
jgi:hypothetical protein